MKDYDIIIIGGGASGMAAAVSAAVTASGTVSDPATVTASRTVSEPAAVTASGTVSELATVTASGIRIVIIEAQPRIGRKLLSTGNGRCNITNRYVSPECYRTDNSERSVLISILDRYGTDEIENFFAGMGVPVFEEREGRMYPRCETASGVLDMLRFELVRLGVETVTETRASEIFKKNGVWNVRIDDKNGVSVFRSPVVIIACGSPANPQLGGCGDGSELVRRLGVRVNNSRPSLCPLLSPSPLLKALKGIRVRCRVSLVHGAEYICSQDGELQFNDGNLSGICVFQLSNRVPDGEQKNAFKDTYIEADYAPYISLEQLLETLFERRGRLSALPAEDFLSGMLNKRLSQAVLKAAHISPMTKPAAAITDAELRGIAGNIKTMRFEISGFAGWKQAQTAVGGIPFSELTERLEIREQHGLFACGESIDCTGDCGGFNLHWAWASGITAGAAAAEYVNNRNNYKHDNK